jgi:hypothetical protein
MPIKLFLFLSFFFFSRIKMSTPRSSSSKPTSQNKASAVPISAASSKCSSKVLKDDSTKAAVDEEVPSPSFDLAKVLIFMEWNDDDDEEGELYLPLVHLKASENDSLSSDDNGTEDGMDVSSSDGASPTADRMPFYRLVVD